MADKSDTALAGAAEIFPPDNLTPAEIARQQIEKSKMNDELGFNELNASRMRSHPQHYKKFALVGPQSIILQMRGAMNAARLGKIPMAEAKRYIEMGKMVLETAAGVEFCISNGVHFELLTDDDAIPTPAEYKNHNRKKITQKVGRSADGAPYREDMVQIETAAEDPGLQLVEERDEGEDVSVEDLF